MLLSCCVCVFVTVLSWVIHTLSPVYVLFCWWYGNTHRKKHCFWVMTIILSILCTDGVWSIDYYCEHMCTIDYYCEHMCASTTVSIHVCVHRLLWACVCINYIVRVCMHWLYCEHTCICILTIIVSIHVYVYWLLLWAYMYMYIDYYCEHVYHWPVCSVMYFPSALVQSIRNDYTTHTCCVAIYWQISTDSQKLHPLLQWNLSKTTFTQQCFLGIRVLFNSFT